MKLPLTLSLYFGRVFALAVAVMLFALTALVSLFDFLELLRESATRPQAGLGIIAEIEVLRMPWSLMQILPFAVLLGGIFAFWRLARSSELVVARAAGISAWQFLAVPVLLAALLGAFGTGGVSPVSALMYSRAEILDNVYLKPGGGPLSLNGGELWVRQADTGLVPDGVAVLHARDVVLHRNSLQADKVTILRLDGQTSLLARIEAAHATLDAGNWMLSDASVLAPDNAPQHADTLAFPTDLTVHRVQESFASPDSLSFWALPGFIRLLKQSGFSATQHELAFQALAALPLLCATMALVAAGFSMRTSRRGGALSMLVSGVASGFTLFMVSEVANQFGTSGAVPVVLAAWAPALAGLFLALALLLHLEDG
ncbi:LPS export ABC transporter permease LptG [Acidocella aromatica]|uniref:Lipopolysaccharide export system permease protein n=1 Tax=Acidocella aromatica TaxID=1303579 RepID=A0A840VD32_9PROT|nr:LPS export ABC transporter permease LptG [Acidocella aromatica]MBB5372767.1 lipopolysaccharide export system permease protein [Acidocella aromatica]